MRLLLLVMLAACKGGPGDTSDSEDSGEVDRGELVGVGLTPYNPSIGLDEHIQFYAQGFYEDGSYEDVGGQVTWSSGDDRVAAVDSSGVAIARGPGSTDIVAVLPNGVAARVQLTVRGGGVTVDRVTVAPNPAELSVGEQLQLTATATLSDGTSGNVTGSCVWSGISTSIATITEGGQIEGVGVGETQVSATCSDISAGSVTVRVAEAEYEWPLADLALSDARAQVTSDGDVLYTARLANIGTGYARAFVVQAFLDSAAAPIAGAAASGSSWFPGMAAGESFDIEVLVPQPAPGSYSSWLVVDLSDQVEEALDRNNAAGPIPVQIAEVAGSPNLQVTELWGISDGLDTFWSAEVENTGTAASGSCWMDLWYDASDIPEAGPEALGDDFVQVPALAPGAGFSWEPETSGGPSGAGTWYSCVLVDSNVDVDESNEDDNVECADVELF